MSEILKGLAQMTLGNPEAPSSSEAAHVALLFAHVGWNRALGHETDGYDKVLQNLVASRPALWSELRSSEPEALIESVRQTKMRLYPNDRRVVLVCGIPNERIHVEWCDERDYPEAVRALRDAMGDGSWRPRGDTGSEQPGRSVTE